MAALGIHLIEINNTRAEIAEAYASRVNEFRDEMAKRNLTMSGVALFSNMADAGRRAELIQHHLMLGGFLAAVGGRYITHMIAPGSSLNEPADEGEYANVDVKAWAANANETGKRLREEHGVELAYHPEQGEIRCGLHERILHETDDRYFRLLADTGHIASGGADSVKLCRDARSRLTGVHLKDFAREQRPVKAGNVPFGKGEVDLRGVVSVLRETAFTGFVMGESGGTNEQMREYMVNILSLNV
jgi:sugar phosphate isomerase/epimerase